MSSPPRRTAVPPPRALAEQQEARRHASPANKEYRVSVSLQDVDVGARKEGLLTQGLNRALMAQGMAGGGMMGMGAIARRPPSTEEAAADPSPGPLSPREFSGRQQRTQGGRRGGRVGGGGGDARSKYEANPQPRARQSEKWIHSAERFPEDELETREFVEEMDEDTFTLAVSIPAHMTKKTVLITKGATVADFLEHIAHSCRLPISEVISSHLILTHTRVHLHPQRKLWSYVLQDRAKVELVKTLPEVRYIEVRMEVDGLDGVERVPYFAQTTVGGICKQMVKKHVQKSRLYGLFTADETILDDSRTLSSFRLESLVYKLKSGKAVRQLAQGSVLLKILLVNASGSKMMKVDRGSKVREAIKRISISANVEQSKLDTYGLFIPLGECLDPEQTFSELKLEDNTTLEYKKCPPHVLQRLVQLREERKAAERVLAEEEAAGVEEDSPEDDTAMKEDSCEDELSTLAQEAGSNAADEEAASSLGDGRPAASPGPRQVPSVQQRQGRAPGGRGGRGVERRARPSGGRGGGNRGGGGRGRGPGGGGQCRTGGPGGGAGQKAAVAPPSPAAAPLTPATAPSSPRAPAPTATADPAPVETPAEVPVQIEADNGGEGDEEEPLLGPMHSWSVERVATWLDRLGFHPAICESFLKAGIDGQQLAGITVQQLRDELGVEALGIRKAILRKVKGQTVAEAEFSLADEEAATMPKISTPSPTTVAAPGDDVTMANATDDTQRSPVATRGSGRGGGGRGGGRGGSRGGRGGSPMGCALGSGDKGGDEAQRRPRAGASASERAGGQGQRTRSEKMPKMKLNKSLACGDRMSAGSAKLAAAPLLAPSQSFTVESMDVGRLRTGAVKALVAELSARKGWEHEGIFRISGDSSKSSKVFASLKNASPNCTDVDVHDVASALKRYLREMDDPLIPMSCYELVCACKGEAGVNVPRLKAMLAMLPRSNYASLKVLMHFCDTVVQHQVVNKMNARNLGIVLGPTCMRVPGDPLKDLSQTGTHVEIFIALIGNFEAVFG